MIKVKILRNKNKSIERDINDFLIQITTSNHDSLKDIKLYPSKEEDVAMVIYKDSTDS